jgi:uncharacterized secreted protein with C-terminal beta-propeller domain
MRRHAKRFGLLLAIAVLPGCNLIQTLLHKPPSGTTDTGSPKLKAFQSEGDLSTYFKQQIEQRNSSLADANRGGMEGVAPLGSADGSSSGAAPAMPGGAPPAPVPTDGSHSGTTIQEVGVDEADVVKTDGTYLYMLDSLNDGSVLRIVQVSPPDQPIAVVSETPLKGYGQDLYLHGDKVVAITTSGGLYYALGGGGVMMMKDAPTATTDPAAANGSGGADVPTAVAISTDAPISIMPPFGGGDFVYQRPNTIVSVVDVTSRSAPAVLSETKFDGTQSATRMIDGVLHMVLANYQNYYFDVMPMLGRPQLDVAGVDVNTLLPTYTRADADGTESGGPVVTWQELYHPVDSDGFGVVTLVSLDVDNNAQFTAVGVVAEPGLIYSSLQALYLTDTNYDWQGNNRTTTDVYKFAYSNRNATPVATGTVQGRILNQYSMSEYAGNLRVATTIDPTWFFDQTTGTGGIVSQSQNSVYVLGESNGSLAVVGKVENIATGESIQSARFMGDKGYVVTFLQTDPLFTVDLSDPTNPRLVGKLEVPGYSTFLTPMDANHVLTVGQYVPPPGQSGNWGVQLSIFDVTDFANPVQSANVVIGADTGAYSEALWDPKAFTYFAERGMVALPVSIYPNYTDVIAIDGGAGSTDGSTGTTDGQTGVTPVDPTIDVKPPTPAQQGFDGVFVYSASPEGGLTELGRISTRFDEAGYWGASFTRGVFIADKVYAVTNLGVREVATSDVSTVEAELFYGQADIAPPPDILPPEPAPLDPTQPVDGGSGSSGSGVSTVGAAGSGGTPTSDSGSVAPAP